MISLTFAWSDFGLFGAKFVEIYGLNTFFVGKVHESADFSLLAVVDGFGFGAGLVMSEGG